MPYLLLLLTLPLAAWVLNGWAERRLMQPDPRYPRPPLPPPVRPRLVCAGDSLTHGNLSANYVEPLAERLPEMEVFNAGINADLAETLLARLGDVEAARPTCVTVLVGTNDVNATLGSGQLRHYRRLGKLRGPALPSPDTYRAHLTAMVRRLRTTGARVALLSLPPLGEDLAHEANCRADAYSVIIREVAQAEGAAYLPLREQLVAELRARPSQPRVRFEQTAGLVRLAAVRRYGLGQSWDAQAAAHGCRFLTDNLHLNTAAAKLIEELIIAWLRAPQR